MDILILLNVNWFILMRLIAREVNTIMFILQTLFMTRIQKLG